MRSRAALWASGAGVTLSSCLSRGLGVRTGRVLWVVHVYFEELNLIVGFGWRERHGRGTVRLWGPRGAGNAMSLWAWGFVRAICRALCFQVTIGVFVETVVKICRFGVIGAVLTVDPRLVVGTGPGGVGRRQN